MEKFTLEVEDYECPYCSGQLGEDLDKTGKRFRYCEICGKYFEVNEDE